MLHKKGFSNRSFTIVLFLLLVLPSLVLTAESEETVSAKDLPPAVKETLSNLRPGLEPEKVEREEDDGFLYFEAEFKWNDTENEIKTDDKGRVVELEEAVLPSHLSPAIQKQIEANYPSHELEEAEQVSLNYYEVEITVNGEETVVRILENGRVLGSESEDEGGENEYEQVVPWESLPAEIKRSIEDHRSGEQPVKIERSLDDGYTYFEAEYSKKNGVTHEVKVDEMGQIVEIEDEIPVDKFPMEARDSLAKSFPNSSIKEVTRKQAVYFTVELEKGDQELELSFLSNGSPIDGNEED